MVPSFHCASPFLSTFLWPPIPSPLRRAPAGMASPLGVAAVRVLLMMTVTDG